MLRTLTVVSLSLAALSGCGQPALPQDPQTPPVMTATAYLAAAKQAVGELPPAEAEQALAKDPDIFLLDVQEYAEYAAGHIRGAVLIPRGYLEFKIAKNDLHPPINRGRVPRPNQPILVYCQLGARSVLAAKTLKEMGYANVRCIQGGLKAWKDAGLPVEKLSSAAGAGAAPSTSPAPPAGPAAARPPLRPAHKENERVE